MCIRDSRIGSKLSAHIGLHRRGFRGILRCMQRPAAGADGGIARSELLCPSHLDGHSFLHPLASLRRKHRQHMAYLFELLRQSIHHHPCILFKHQITSNGFGLLQIVQIAAQNGTRPYQELARAHGAKQGEMILAGGTAAAVVDLAQHNVFLLNNAFDGFVHVVLTCPLASFHVRPQGNLAGRLSLPPARP